MRKNRGIAGDISTTITYDNFVKELTKEARREFIPKVSCFTGINVWDYRLIRGVPR
ncbi:MAG: hypothetical protein ACLU4N_19925 [Butyricimonas faecihominis]